jgi:MOSC domain-containing protein YiiM
MARLLSVNVGLPRDIEWKGRTVHTAIWKDPLRGRCRVGRLNLEGDGQGDLAGHGGEQRAVFVYQIESYRHWQVQLRRDDFVHGQFGENFTIEGLPDDAVCIGDRYQIGSALFEVTQPRVTCYRVGIRMNEPRMPALLTSSGRPGFYLRVLKEDEVGPGDEIVRVGEAKERMTVAEINALLYSPNHARDRLERALRIEALSPGWRSSFEALLQSQMSGNAGLVPEAAAHPASPGFRPLQVTAIDQESADVLSLTMQSPNSSAAANGDARPVRGRASSTDRRRPAALSQLLAFGSPLDRALLRICPGKTPTRVRWYRLRAVASPHTGTRRPTRAFWNWPRRATSQYVGRAGPVFVTTVRAVWFRGRSSTNQSHSTSPRTATFSFAARNRFATSSSTCEPDWDLKWTRSFTVAHVRT